MHFREFREFLEAMRAVRKDKSCYIAAVIQGVEEFARSRHWHLSM